MSEFTDRHQPSVRSPIAGFPHVSTPIENAAHLLHSLNHDLEFRRKTTMIRYLLLLALLPVALNSTGCAIALGNEITIYGDEDLEEEEFTWRLDEPRLAPLERADLNEEQVALMDGIPPQMAQLNIFKTLVRAPTLMQNFAPLGGYLVSQSTLPARDREVLILRTAWNAEAEYEWGQHTQIGRTLGMTDADFARIAIGFEAEGLSSWDETLLVAVDDLFYETMLSDEAWEDLADVYTEEQIIELTFTVGEYNMIAMALNSAGVQLEEGVEGFPEE